MRRLAVLALLASFFLLGYKVNSLLNVGDVVSNGKGVFPDSLRTNGGLTVGAACMVVYDSLKVAGTVRGNSGLQIGGALVSKIIRASATLDFDLTSATSQDLTVSVPGAALGDQVSLGVPNGSVTADTIFYSWVSSAGTVTVRASRVAGTPNPASGTFKVTVFQ